MDVWIEHCKFVKIMINNRMGLSIVIYPLLFCNCEKKFDALLETSKSHAPNDKYENFITAHQEPAAECISSKTKFKRKVPWESKAGMENQVNLKKATFP